MELALFSVKKAWALYLTSVQTIAMTQSVCGNFDSYCKMSVRHIIFDVLFVLQSEGECCSLHTMALT